MSCRGPTKSFAIDRASHSGGVAIEDLHLHFLSRRPALVRPASQLQGENNWPATEEAMRECGWMELQEATEEEGPKSRDPSFPCTSREPGEPGWISDFCPLQSCRLLPLVRQGVGGMRSGQAGGEAPAGQSIPARSAQIPRIAGAGHAPRNRPEQRSAEALSYVSVNCRLMLGRQVLHKVGLP